MVKSNQYYNYKMQIPQSGHPKGRPSVLGVCILQLTVRSVHFSVPFSKSEQYSDCCGPTQPSICTITRKNNGILLNQGVPFSFLPEIWMVTFLRTTHPPISQHCLNLGTGHYLWPGGAESKVGRHRKYFEVQRVGIEKKLRSHEWASKKIPPKNFRRCRGIF